MLSTVSGTLSSDGADSYEAAKISFDDFNDYLANIVGEDAWKLKMVFEDSETNPDVALEKVMKLHEQGIDIIVGPLTSANTKNVKEYADANNMLVISCCSSAPSLAIEGDSVLRMVPDDTHQGIALAKIIRGTDIDVIVPVWRGDAWGIGLAKATSDAFVKNGGMSDEGIQYVPDMTDFEGQASMLNDKIQMYTAEYGEAKVGVILLGFAEISDFVEAASKHDSLSKVRWFGSGGNQNAGLLQPEFSAFDFSKNVQFISIEVTATKNADYMALEDKLTEKLGRQPSTFGFTTYDLVQILGRTIYDTQSTDATVIKDTFATVADMYGGAVGSTRLNAAGDLQAADYDIWGLDGSEWKVIGKYTSSDDAVMYN